ncbi:MAG TPA: SHOCT domain-containing protein [Solirubrobacteraceae bacterium]|nr:SHOCT domain-containing protein [Solirubrobacteraceae bacterium]
MFVRRRRPLLGAAMIGGGVLAGRRSVQNSYRESDQEQRLEQLEQAQQAPPAPAAAPAAPAASGGDDLVEQLQQLSKLLDSGALTQDEFDAAKRKLLAG